MALVELQETLVSTVEHLDVAEVGFRRIECRLRRVGMAQAERLGDSFDLLSRAECLTGQLSNSRLEVQILIEAGETNTTAIL